MQSPWCGVPQVKVYLRTQDEPFGVSNFICAVLVHRTMGQNERTRPDQYVVSHHHSITTVTVLLARLIMILQMHTFNTVSSYSTFGGVPYKPALVPQLLGTGLPVRNHSFSPESGCISSSLSFQLLAWLLFVSVPCQPSSLAYSTPTHSLLGNSFFSPMLMGNVGGYRFKATSYTIHSIFHWYIKHMLRNHSFVRGSVAVIRPD